MIGAQSRRGFLSGLASLPLIGGGITLIGNPTAAAVPVTDALQARYLAWLAHEHRAAVREHAFRSAMAHARLKHYPEPLEFARGEEAGADYLGWLPDAPDVAAMVRASATSSRAAIVLSAVGCPLAGPVL